MSIEDICLISFVIEINKVKELNLVYKDYIEFLKTKGLSYELKEGYYWLDKSIIKAFDKEGNIHKVLRIKIDDNLDMTFSKYKEEVFEIESWNETASRNYDRLMELESNSIKLIKSSIDKYKGYKPNILTSGGKDSSVVSHLVKRVDSNTLSIFNNTTLDCADTYLHIKKEPHLLIINPKEGFYQWRERLNFVPTRFSRACCGIFKEGAMVENLDKNTSNIFFMGMRNDESNTRSGYGDEWKNHKWGERKWIGVLPIREWKELDIWLYIVLRNIDVNPKYKKGYARVGCAVSCPYYAKSTWVLDKHFYPFLYNRWHNILDKDFIENKKAPIMNCTLEEYHLTWNGGMVRDEPTEEVIEEFSKQQGLNIKIATKYFGKKCMECDKKLKKDDVALSMKFYGRHIENFKCINCLSKDFNVAKKELKSRIVQFKNQGCDLF